MDHSKTGFLKVNEIKQTLTLIQDETFEELSKDLNWELILEKMDLNNDGLVDYNDFVSSFSSRRQFINDKNIEEAFNSIDLKKTGYISVDEI